MNWKIQKVIEFFAANLHRQIHMAEISNVVGLSPSRLHDLFKAELGMPPMQYLKTLRMEKACVLLQDPAMKIKQVQLAIGYQDQRYFLRDFKKQFGLTPSQYRARQVAALLTAGEQTERNQEN
ncbi:MAG: helix-turn-helix transcriptional regulator [Blastocatellia bacterium]